MKITKFEDLEVWKLSMKFVKTVYTLTNNHKFTKDFDLVRQIRRATVSISSNIVEGFERNNNNELIRTLKISKGSAGEVKNQLYIALSLSYISKEEFLIAVNELQTIMNQLGKFISYLHKKRVSQPTRSTQPAKLAKLAQPAK